MSLKNWLLLVASPPLLECTPIYGDMGLTRVGELSAHQEDYPVTVELVYTPDIDDSMLGSAISWWANDAGFDVFEPGSPGEVRVYEAWLDNALDGEKYPPAGLAGIRVDAYGDIVECEVTISYGIAYHYSTTHAVLLHELGHCIGLDDDIGMDIGSIMADPAMPGTRLTNGDRRLIR